MAEKIAEKQEHELIPTKKRIPVYKQRVYDYSGLRLDHKKFHYHWANGFPANLEKYFTGGYQKLLDKDGKPITRRGKNEELYQYLLYIPIELYNEDSKGKLEEPNSIEASMRAGTAKGNPFLSPQYSYGGIQTLEQVGTKLTDMSTGMSQKITKDSDN